MLFRASIVGGQLHAQGSVSTATHARNLVKKYKLVKKMMKLINMTYGNYFVGINFGGHA